MKRWDAGRRALAGAPGRAVRLGFVRGSGEAKRPDGGPGKRLIFRWKGLILAGMLFWAACPALLPGGAGEDVVRESADDFSQGGWTRFESTPGTLRVEPGRLELVDGPEAPEWVTASKVLPVDFDRTPFLVVKVQEATRGTVKLIRRDSKEKREVLSIDGPGIYAMDLRQAYGWTGATGVETCLYALGDQNRIVFAWVKYAAALSPEEAVEVKQRQAEAEPELDVASFELEALFHSCSYYFRSAPRDSLQVEFRRCGDPDWKEAFPPVYVPEDGMYRGSVVRLEEDTDYELRLRDEKGGGGVLAQGEFRTWRGEVPVGETIVLDESNFTGTLRIARSGTPDGWLRYTAKKGFVLRNDRKGPLLDLVRARYVLLDGLTLRGGLQVAVSVDRCQHVRIVNCDIAGWGRIGQQRFDLNGAFYTEGGKQINWDTGILIRRSMGTVVERCYLHDPVTTANSWYYAHPAGPQAVGIAKPRSTVLRYNDFIGSDEHRWNDATEGEGNFDRNGGFNRDADIYGNFACFANDDALEIDGGQINVRVFDNWYEGCLCGVSIQGCMAGPSYVFNNLLVNMGDERNLAGQSIKTSSNTSGPSAVSYILGNTTFGEARDLGLQSHLKIVARNNLFAGASNITGRRESPRSDCDFNLEARGQEGSEPHGVTGEPGLTGPGEGLYQLREDSRARGRGVALPDFTVPDSPVDLGAIPWNSGRSHPVRPVSLPLDRYQVCFTAGETAAGAGKSVTARGAGDGFAGEFRIARNEAFDWFRVEPAQGTLRPGREQVFTVHLEPRLMKARALYKGAFLVRLSGGHSRPVLVYAATDYRQPVKPERQGVWTQFQEAESFMGEGRYETVADPAASGGRGVNVSGKSSAQPADYRFTVPRAGKYFVVLRVRAASGGRGSVQLGVDGGPMERCQLRGEKDWRWCLAAQNRSMSLICLQGFDWGPGEHLIRIAPRESVQMDLVAVTDDPKPFE